MWEPLVRKSFFFEKKNQKTFALGAIADLSAQAGSVVQAKE
jgi:hypothetical protein